MQVKYANKEIHWQSLRENEGLVYSNTKSANQLVHMNRISATWVNVPYDVCPVKNRSVCSKAINTDKRGTLINGHISTTTSCLKCHFFLISKRNPEFNCIINYTAKPWCHWYTMLYDSGFSWTSSILSVYIKKVGEKSSECYNHKPQPFPDTKRLVKVSTSYSSTLHAFQRMTFVKRLYYVMPVMAS